jgi:16S rRNA (adenine1518-N6/adenine1519-N6)-dimethyltransferase
VSRARYPLTTTDVRVILEEEGIRPSRRLGQRFLVDGNMLRFVVDALGTDGDESILEIGTGLGNLTGLLLEKGCAVLTVEKDSRLFAAARRLLPETPRLRIFEGDALVRGRLSERVVEAWRHHAIEQDCRSYAVASNFPYEVASTLLPELLAKAPRPLRAIVGTIQWEVARRLRAEPGTTEFGPLTVAVGLRGRVEVLRRLSPLLFWPRPKVDSAVVRIVPAPEAVLADANLARASELARRLLPLRRRTLGSALRTTRTSSSGELAAVLSAAGLDFGRRVSTLSLEEWRRLGSTVGVTGCR